MNEQRAKEHSSDTGQGVAAGQWQGSFYLSSKALARL